jgi:tetratricopeptide (TPR) repeat protein
MLDERPVWPLVLAALAFLLKLAYVLETREALFARVPIMDSAYYDAMARDIAGGQVLRPGAFFMGPLYPYVLGLVYAVFGRDFTVVRLLQALGGSATVALTFVLGRMVFRPSVGLVGALCLCLYGTITFYEGHLLMTWLGTLLNLGALVVLVRGAASGKTAAFAAAGALIGLSALARANVLLFVPVALAWIVWVSRQSARSRRAVAFAASTAVFVFLAAVHNFAASRDFVLVTANAGLNFYIGNSRISQGTFFPPHNVDFEDPTSRTYVEREMGRDMRPSEISRYWFDRTLDDMADEPGRAAARFARKAAMFASGYEIPQIESFDIARGEARMLRVLFVRYWWLGALALVGVLLSRASWRRYALLLGFVGAYAASIVVFFVTARYRVQIAPVVALFAGHALVSVLPGALASVRRAAAMAGLLIVALALTHPAIFAWDPGELYFREHVHRARRLGELHRYPEALGEIDRAIALFPDYAEGYVHRAEIHKEGGDLFKTAEDYARALDLDPGLASVHYDLAQALRRLNLDEEAVAAYEAAVRADPLMIQAYNNLGVAYRDLGRNGAAAATFRRAIEIDPKYVKGYNNLGACLAEMDRLDEAIATFEEAIERFPEYANSYKNLAMAYAQAQRARDAAHAMESYLRLAPQDAAARAWLEKLYVAVRADTTSGR